MPYTLRVSTLRFFTTIVLLVILVPCAAQQQFGSANSGDIVIAVVPMIGLGTYDDPRRPQLVPIRKGAEKKLWDEDFDYRYIPSDDGRHAIVVFRATDKEKLSKVSKSRAEGITVFERGKDKLSDILKEARKYKKDFTLEELLGIPPVPDGKTSDGMGVVQ